MTEEKKDSPPPKLRLSREPKDVTPEPPPADDPKAEPKPDLKLRRPESEEAAAPPPEDRPFDPENPFAGIDVKKPGDKRQPPELPSKPPPVDNDGSGRKVEEAIGQIGDEKKKHGILISIIILLILLAILGGSAYGLYYLLRSPAEKAEATTATTKEPVVEPAEKESGGLLSGPIEKARAVIGKKAEVDADLEEAQRPGPAAQAPSASTAETAETAVPADSPEKPAAPKTEARASAIDSSRTDAVSGFLQNAHIGGVRTGDRPKLILNGQSYNQGDLVDADTGLRFIGFRDKKLAFRDAQGVVYIKSL